MAETPANGWIPAPGSLPRWESTRLHLRQRTCLRTGGAWVVGTTADTAHHNGTTRDKIGIGLTGFPCGQYYTADQHTQPGSNQHRCQPLYRLSTPYGVHTMKLAHIEIQNFRAIPLLEIPLNDELTVLHGDNADGKTSVLSAIAAGLGSIPRLLPGVSGTDLRANDLRGKGPMRVTLTTHDGIAWYRRRNYQGTRTAATKELQQVLSKIVAADQESCAPINLPIVAYYDTDRAVFDVPQRRSRSRKELSRYAALDGALSARTNFRAFFNWFYEKEFEELRLQRDNGPRKLELKDLGAVRKAIESMIPGASNPRIASRPSRFVVSMNFGAGSTEQLAIDQMSGGYRIMLALAADLARRMAQGNPHLEDPLQSEAIVLIDEVELHLHPSWQQRVLTDLTRTFPNTQFIVSTHSPQVLTTIRPEEIIELHRDASGIVAMPVSGPTYGAEAGDVLESVMGVRERPSHNQFVKLLDEYTEHVSNGTGESEAAWDIRRQLESLSHHDPGLDRADIEIRRQRILHGMDQSR